jgi:hypothetical protein
VLTDYNNLKGFIGVTKLNGRQARWATFLASFDFVIEYRAGKTNLADAPSRRPDYAYDKRAPSHLLPILQNKLAVWKDDSDLAPSISRVRAQRDHLLGVGDTHAYTRPRAIVRAVVNAASRHEDPFKDLTVDLTTIIKSLQTNDDALEALLKSSRDVGDEFAWRKVRDL